MKQKRLWSFMLYFSVIISMTITTLLLKNRNDFTFLLTIIVTSILYLFSLSNFKKLMDYLVVLLLPLFLTISKTIWIAHPIIESRGFLSVSTGFYIKLIDFLILYMFFRLPYIQHTRIKKIFYCYIVVTFISSIYAINAEASIAEGFVYVKCLIVYLWMSNKKKQNKNINILLNGLEMALLFQGVIAILQNISGGPIGLQFLGESNDALRYRIVDGVIERGSAGTFDHSGQLAIFTLFTLLNVYFLEKNIMRRNVYIVLGLLVMYCAASRTAIIILFSSLVFGKICEGVLKIKKEALIKMLVGSAFFICIVFFMLQKHKLDFIFNSDLVFQIGNRINQWLLALSFVGKRIFLGYGANNYSTKMMQINSSNFFYMNPVHNNYILHWFEVGLIGAIIYVCIFILYLKKFKTFKNAHSVKKASLLFILCVSIYNFTGWTFATTNCIYLFWMAMGLVDSSSAIDI